MDITALRARIAEIDTSGHYVAELPIVEELSEAEQELADAWNDACLREWEAEHPEEAAFALDPAMLAPTSAQEELGQSNITVMHTNKDYTRYCGRVAQSLDDNGKPKLVVWRCRSWRNCAWCRKLRTQDFAGRVGQAAYQRAELVGVEDKLPIYMFKTSIETARKLQRVYSADNYLRFPLNADECVMFIRTADLAAICTYTKHPVRIVADPFTAYSLDSAMLEEYNCDIADTRDLDFHTLTETPVNMRITGKLGLSQEHHARIEIPVQLNLNVFTKPIEPAKLIAITEKACATTADDPVETVEQIAAAMARRQSCIATLLAADGHQVVCIPIRRTIRLQIASISDYEWYRGNAQEKTPIKDIRLLEDIADGLVGKLED